MKKCVIVFVGIIVVSVLLILGIWYYAVPDDYVVSRIEQIKISPLRLELDGFSKGLFLNFSLRDLIIRNGEQEIWRITGVGGRIDPLKFFSGKAEIDVRGSTYGGTLAGVLHVAKGGAGTDMTFQGIDLASITSLKDMGVNGNGRLSGSLYYRDTSGKIEFLVENADIESISGGDVSVPVKYFHTIRGAIDILSPSSATIRSISLEGKGIYARVKGSVVNNVADLGVEIMPEPSFEDSSLFLLLDQYRISEGYFYIPLKTNLSRIASP